MGAHEGMAGEACRTLESGRRVSAPFVPIRRDQPPVGELLPGCHPEIRCGVAILGGAFFLKDSFPYLEITQESGDSLGILSLDFALVTQRLREDPGVVWGPGGRGGARRFSLDPEIAFRTRRSEDFIGTLVFVFGPGVPWEPGDASKIMKGSLSRTKGI
ncbi:hypothetical protein DY000_02039649 [Brassica cretica]|uniref:Uncharacterized protein n=1 Tax=Brassica cretica TaxID=69181 RepID=A0ABQ7BQF1_BRACR|nr:hypothetical protein DY000_02039649 [Brassica cretica]